MAFVPDETLMAYADGELAADDRRQLEAMLAADQPLRARLEPFITTGSPLADLFGKPMREPVPARLVAAVDAALRANERVAARRAGRGTGLRDFLERTHAALFDSELRLAGPAFALTAAGLLAAGGASGWALKTMTSPAGSPMSVVLTDTTGLYASAALRTALDTLPSSQQAPLNSGATVTPALSFMDHAKRFCRTYVIDTGKAVRLAGVACRSEDAGWRIPVQAELAAPAQSGGGTYGSADGDGSKSPAVEKYLDGAMDGPGLGTEEEAAAIANGWAREQR